MSDVRPQLESLLAERIALALSALPDGGREYTPERAELVEQTVAKFVRDVKTVAEHETAGRSAATG